VSEARVELVALGERAWRFALPGGAVRRRALLARLRAIEGVVDVVLADELGAVIVGGGVAAASVTDALGSVVKESEGESESESGGVRTISVVYDGEDLEEVARTVGVTRDGLIALHAHRDYEVAMVGFMPGFAYLRGLDPRLLVARRDVPRTRVPPRSVALAAGYTGIYPFASPGGWHLLGEAIGFMPFGADGAALAVGDRVRFAPTDRTASPPARAPLPASRRSEPWLEVRAARGPALLIDGGRPGHMHEGVPHGGPMVRSALAKANAAVGNARGECAIEIYGALEIVARGGRVRVGDDVRGGRVLEDGEAFVVATEGRTRVRYLAVEGGLEVPVVLGGRGTMLAAGMGGLEGRALRRGDGVSARESERESESESESARESARERESESESAIMRGPDADARELEEILATTFTIAAAADRTGTRLDGLRTSVHSAPDRKSGPMVRGAIERTPSGLIVLGPDHPTTGGYPVVAVLREGAMDCFFNLPIGHEVRFVART
jgi:KipI family sensor histidine kinase inhibitor